VAHKTIKKGNIKDTSMAVSKRGSRMSAAYPSNNLHQTTTNISLNNANKVTNSGGAGVSNQLLSKFLSQNLSHHQRK
jgi:hypothetical protein